MNYLERFYACMNYEPVDHVPFWEWGGWPETNERWIKEGFRPGVDDLAMGADSRIFLTNWFFPNPPFEREVVEQDEEHILYINHEGILMREMVKNPWSSMPQFVRFPVETPEEFRAFWAKKMQADLTKRISPDWQNQLKGYREMKSPLVIFADRWGGFFGPLRNMLGVERLSELFYDDPDFLEEMMDANADFIIQIMDQVLDVVSIDMFAFWEDMAYNTAPLLSPQMARKYMLPRYKRVIDHLSRRGVPFFGLDSDGQMDPLIPIWMDAGINTLWPFEVQSGMDVNAVRKKYGKGLRMWGGIDKRAIAWGLDDIEKELARVKPLMLEGGYIPHPDHSIPPDTSFQNFLYFQRRLKEECGA